MNDNVSGRDLQWINSQPKRDPSLCYWENPVQCPACLGVGKLSPTMHCNNCNGWGYQRGRSCLHTRRAMTKEELQAKRLYPLGRCERASICTQCGDVNIVDSSD